MEQNNMRYYDALKTTPEEAKKKITGGRLNGFTDINPSWRYHKLTELFGPCGIGWKFEIIDQKIIPHGEEAKAFVQINLYIKDGEKWSDPIPGLGGSSFISKDRSGLYCSDECFKMAQTDALGTACKFLGMSEDVYWSEGYTKYTAPQNTTDPPAIPCMVCGNAIAPITKRDGSIWQSAEIIAYSESRFGRKLCPDCQKKAIAAEKKIQQEQQAFDASLAAALPTA